MEVSPATVFTGLDEFSGGVETTGLASVCHFAVVFVRYEGLDRVSVVFRDVR